jgi:pyruvate dehydrogenase E2 component (dihydrolipoamide acetyltransferase)
MTLTLSCDHHILYGVEAAEFLAAVRDLLEAPLRVAL